MQVLLCNVEGAKSTLATDDIDLSDMTIIVLVETMSLEELNIESFKCINQKETTPPSADRRVE